jgi:hypothetical protein
MPEMIRLRRGKWRASGSVQIDLLGNSDTVVTLPYVRPEVASGLVQSVSGSVVNEDGEPFPKAQVALVSEIRAHGEKRLSTGPLGLADERGDFKLSPVPPGTYYLVASSKSGAETYSSTFYPSAPDAESSARRSPT